MMGEIPKNFHFMVDVLVLYVFPINGIMYHSYINSYISKFFFLLITFSALNYLFSSLSPVLVLAELR